ncbi:MAG: hybrid sensor histidine kinase/response regulator [Betaproteobacteria bacterium]
MDTSELIRALQSEVEGIAGDLAASFSAMAAGGDGVPQARESARESYESQVERLAATASLMGMQGLETCCARVREALRVLDLNDSQAVASSREFFDGWPALVITYLAKSGDAGACSTLAAHFSAVPGSADDGSAADLALLLSAPPDLTAEIRDAAGPARPTVAAVEDTSLVLPADLDQSMFEGFMQEAPGHAAEFSMLVSRIVAGKGTPEVLKEAKRIAHTFKGSANIVGIKGIARLGHHTEDILEYLQDHPEALSPALGNTLLDVAGCLEQMVCYLLGQEDQPQNARAVLQGVLDWANRVDSGTMNNAEADAVAEAVPVAPDYGKAKPAPAGDGPQPGAQPEAAPAAAAQPEQSLRVPVKTLDDLFRLTSELAIKVGQFQSRLKQVTQRSKHLLDQNLAVQKRIFELENLVDIRGFAGMQGQRSAAVGEFDSLEMDQYNELHMVTRALAEETADTRELGREIEEDIAQLGGTLLQQDRIRREMQHLALSTRMSPVNNILPRLTRNVRQTCRSTGKQADLLLIGGDTMLDGEILNRLADPLLHILRNAIDHGIESPEERELLGKPLVGSVTLSFLRQGQGLIVRCVDDGRGLDYAAIRAKAIERDLITASQSLSQQELARLIMLPGFSTRDSVSEISGRGVGLDVVRERVLSMKGSVDITSAGSGMGTMIELRLQASLTALHVLLVEAAGQIFGLPSYGIEHAMAPGVAEVVHVADQLHLKHGNAVFPVRTLADLVGASGLPGDPAKQVAVLMQVDGKSTALLVDKLIDARDLIAKDLGQFLKGVKGLNGAAVLGDGSVAPLLDIAAMLREPSMGSSRDFTDGSAADEREQRTRIVVVDDSLSVRRLLTELLQDSGYVVEAAKDGIEAVQMIDSFRPHAVLTDMEMPNMNGLELTARLRAGKETQNLPVIMITSRSLEKHRRQAELSGVSVYLTKPYSDHDLLSHLQAQLKGGHHVAQNIH